MRTLIEPEKLAKQLLDFRAAKKMTQEHLALKVIGVPTFTLRRWEKALVRISPMMYAHLKRLKII